MEQLWWLFTEVIRVAALPELKELKELPDKTFYRKNEWWKLDSVVDWTEEFSDKTFPGKHSDKVLTIPVTLFPGAH